MNTLVWLKLVVLIICYVYKKNVRMRDLVLDLHVGMNTCKAYVYLINRRLPSEKYRSNRTAIVALIARPGLSASWTHVYVHVRVRVPYIGRTTYLSGPPQAKSPSPSLPISGRR